MRTRGEISGQRAGALLCECASGELVYVPVESRRGGGLWIPRAADADAVLLRAIAWPVGVAPATGEGVCVHCGHNEHVVDLYWPVLR